MTTLPFEIYVNLTAIIWYWPSNHCTGHAFGI